MEKSVDFNMLVIKGNSQSAPKNRVVLVGKRLLMVKEMWVQNIGNLTMKNTVHSICVDMLFSLDTGTDIFIANGNVQSKASWRGHQWTLSSVFPLSDCIPIP